MAQFPSSHSISPFGLMPIEEEKLYVMTFDEHVLYVTTAHTQIPAVAWFQEHAAACDEVIGYHMSDGSGIATLAFVVGGHALLYTVRKADESLPEEISAGIFDSPVILAGYDSEKTIILQYLFKEANMVKMFDIWTTMDPLIASHPRIREISSPSSFKKLCEDELEIDTTGIDWDVDLNVCGTTREPTMKQTHIIAAKATICYLLAKKLNIGA